MSEKTSEMFNPLFRQLWEGLETKPPFLSSLLLIPFKYKTYNQFTNEMHSARFITCTKKKCHQQFSFGVCFTREHQYHTSNKVCFCGKWLVGMTVFCFYFEIWLTVSWSGSLAWRSTEWACHVGCDVNPSYTSGLLAHSGGSAVRSLRYEKPSMLAALCAINFRP